MINSMGKMCAVLVLALLLVPAGVMASIATIAPGNTVFLGEQGLDITAAMDGDSKIGWWASAAVIQTTSPDRTIQVSDPRAFAISPSDFVGYLGVWYRLNQTGAVNGTAFTVSDPNLDIRVMDETLGVDATTNGWITTGSEVSFKITTNLYQMGQRPSASGAPITIKVRAPDGAVYSALINKAGTTTNIAEVWVSNSPYSTGAIWDTGKSDTYPYGTYGIWAECNANSMKDNYGYAGKTYTESQGLLDQERNPLIGTYYTSTATRTTVATTVPTTVKTTAPTTVPTTVLTTTAAPTTIATATLTTPPTALPTAAATKSPGFEFIPAGAALLLALAFIVRKE